MSSWAGFASSPRTQIQESSRGRTAFSPALKAFRADCVSTPRPRLLICASSCGSRPLSRQAGRELHGFSNVSLWLFGPSAGTSARVKGVKILYAAARRGSQSRRWKPRQAAGVGPDIQNERGTPSKLNVVPATVLLFDIRRPSGQGETIESRRERRVLVEYSNFARLVRLNNRDGTPVCSIN